MFKSISIFTGGANRPLAEATAACSGIRLGQADLTRFSDGEIFARIGDNVRSADVYVIQPTCSPVNDNLMELLVTVRSSATINRCSCRPTRAASNARARMRSA